MGLVKTIAKLMPAGMRNFVRKKMEDAANEKLISAWKAEGSPLPPPSVVKRKIISEFQKKNKLAIFVETGTYLGDTVQSQKENFSRIYSIELGADLHKNAVERFRDQKHITLLQGDSGVVLKSLIKEINAPALFWLDGHYSEGITAKGEKDCPIYEELNAIFTSSINHVLFIDDAKLFNGKTPDYPDLEELSTFVLKNRPKSRISVSNDIIQIICA